MNLRRATGFVIASAALAAPLIASAATFNYYTPPKIKVRGASSAPAAGKGTVVVQVFVTKTGKATKFKIVKSSNPGDNSTALEIAQKSTYVPASKGAAKQDAFYDYTLNFTTAGASTGGDVDAATGVGKYKLMISGGNYSGAAAGLKSYLEANPNDAAAELQLGIADQYLNDPLGAAAAFDKAGTIPANYDAIAVRAYSDAAGAAFKNKDYPSSVDFAKKAVAISPGVGTYNTLGTAEDGASQPDAAIADLETARKLAAADSTMKPSERATIDDNLVSAYVNAGKIDQAKVVAAEALKFDSSHTNAQAFIAAYYVKQGTAAEGKQNLADAGAFYEQAAAIAPAANQPSLYARAAFSYLNVKPNPLNDKAKAAADKALAIAPDNAQANFAEGVSLANQPGKSKDALVYLNKADASAKTANDTSLTSAIENIIKQLGGSK